MLGLELAHDLVGGAPLLVVMIENGRAILRADVAALAIQGRGVVEREEDAEQVAVGELVRVEGHLHYFRVSSRAGADGLVAGVRHMTA